MVAIMDANPVALINEPLSLVPPDIAGQIEIQRYVWAATTAVFIWDILNNVKADYQLLAKYPVRWPVVAYFISRIVSFVYVLGFTIFLTYPVGGCSIFAHILNSLYPVAVCSTSLLFFFRVRAIYCHTRTVTFVFGALWIIELAACITIPFGTNGTNIGPTRYCTVGELAPFVGGAAIAPPVFDTAVFLAISFRLVGNTDVAVSWSEKCRAIFMISRVYLPSFSKALFEDGQVYYMMTVISNIATSVMVYVPGVSVGSRGLVAVSNVMLTSVMACRVYRNTRLGLSHKPPSMPGGLSATTNSRSLNFVNPTANHSTRYTIPSTALETGGPDDSQRSRMAQEVETPKSTSDVV
ncbi:hypothetical protein FB451DRAFT_1249509 [Mycena latifolia]|nr:hypothetical protein FB451DRAFT_1249509 [Mycena latifolia]